MKLRFPILVLALTAPVAYGSQANIKLSGKVVSDKGVAIENSQVRLLVSGSAAMTGADGRYSLSQANSIGRRDFSPGAVSYRVENGNLHFRTRAPQHARLEIFGLDGQSIGIVADRDFPIGDHRIDLERRIDPAKAFFLVGRIGSTSLSAMGIHIDGRLIMRLGPGMAGFPQSHPLRKVSPGGYVDTLLISAPLFESRKFALTSLEGTIDVVLQPSFSARLGDGCAGRNQYAHGDGSLLLCESGKYRYALPADVPTRPSGGFTARPDWFPTLFGGDGALPFPPGDVKFTHAPVDPEKIFSIIPHGAMIGDHITPIDHAYLNVATLLLDQDARKTAEYIPVVAPADGFVVEMGWLGPNPNQMRVVMAHGNRVFSVYIVLNKLGGALAKYSDSLAANHGFWNKPIPVKGGEIFGLQRDNPLDFSVHDGKVWLSGFAHPFPYVSGDPWKPYTADPSAYFPPGIAHQLESKCQRTTAPRWGKIDWDIPGTASGNWYREGTIGYSGNPVGEYQTGKMPGPLQGKNIYAWSHLTLAPHWVQPSVWMASLGTWSDAAGDGKQFAIKSGPMRPDSVTAASGTVVYELVSYARTDSLGKDLDHRLPEPVGYLVRPTASVEGILAVRVNGDGTLTVERRPDLKSAAAFTAFTGKAEKYWR